MSPSTPGRRHRPLGSVQASFLRAMARESGLGASNPPGTWHAWCGWTWGGHGRDVRIARSLERRGLIEETEGDGRPGPYFVITEAGRIAVAEVAAHEWNDTPPEVHEERRRAAQATKERYAAEQREMRLRGAWGSFRDGRARAALEAIAAGDLNDPAGFARMVLDEFEE